MNGTNHVRVEHAEGQWTVFVVEGGHTSRHEFETEQFARNFAAGQRLRIGHGHKIPPRKRLKALNWSQRG